MVEKTECVIIGAGVVGSAISRALARAGRDVILLERNEKPGMETSSRNSEVIHAGLYYPDDSLKAKFCVEGRDRLYAYASARDVGHSRCGKVVIAATADEIPALETIYAQSHKNGVTDTEMWTAAEVAAHEPAVRAAAGLCSPSSGIIDSHNLITQMLLDMEAAGGVMAVKSPFEGATVDSEGFLVSVGGREPMKLQCRFLINAAGLWAQEAAAQIAGLDPAHIPAVHLAIGQYYVLGGRSPFNGLVYPLPVKGSLGIHATPDMSGQTRFGPDIRSTSVIDYVFDDRRKEAFVDAIRPYFPDLPIEKLAPGHVGIRPRLVPVGDRFADFRIDGPNRHGIGGLVNLFGIESPGLTSSMAIGTHVRNMIAAMDHSHAQKPSPR